jgi:hypothetical protein
MYTYILPVCKKIRNPDGKKNSSYFKDKIKLIVNYSLASDKSIIICLVHLTLVSETAGMELFLSWRKIIFVVQISLSFIIGESQGVKWREVRLLSSEGRVKLNCIFSIFAKYDIFGILCLCGHPPCDY